MKEKQKDFRKEFKEHGFRGMYVRLRIYKDHENPTPNRTFTVRAYIRKINDQDIILENGTGYFSAMKYERICDRF